MPIEVVRRAPDCALCDAVWGVLDDILKLQPAEATPADREHFLASVCAWWVAQSLAQFNGEVEPMMMCLVDALKEHGVRLIPIEDTSESSRPS